MYSAYRRKKGRHKGSKRKNKNESQTSILQKCKRQLRATEKQRNRQSHKNVRQTNIKQTKM